MGLKQVMHLKPYTDRNLHDNHQLTLDHSVTCQLFKKKNNQPNKQPTLGISGQHFFGQQHHSTMCLPLEPLTISTVIQISYMISKTWPKEFSCVI